MATVSGTVNPFDSMPQSWEEYSEMLDFFFDANKIDDQTRKEAVLLSAVGATTYNELRSLASPAAPKDKTYSQLTEVLNAHFNPKSSVI